MFAVIKELTDRFIEFVMRYIGGDTVEEKLKQLVNTAIYFIAGLLWVVIGLMITIFNQRIEIADLETGVEKINVLFNTSEDGGPLGGFIKVNNSLIGQVAELNKENLLMAKDNVKLNDENHFLKFQLLTMLGRNKELNDNLAQTQFMYNQLSRICALPPPNPLPPFVTDYPAKSK